ncbi:hypothetical protein JRQ81_002001, partial [Phrynocephalus forsythii]
NPQLLSMLLGYSPVMQALLGTFLTWGLTAAGAALVFIFSSGQRRILDGSLGFAAGVMLAASYWSLLAPAIELAEDSGKFGMFAFLPIAVGFTLGAAFVYLADLLLPWLGISEPPYTALALSCDSRVAKEKYEDQSLHRAQYENELSIRIGRTALHSDKGENGEPYQRRKGAGGSQLDGPAPSQAFRDSTPVPPSSSWRRITLLILAITIHNIPEGLAVGVGFGAVGKSASATFESARFRAHSLDPKTPFYLIDHVFKVQAENLHALIDSVLPFLSPSIYLMFICCHQVLGLFHCIHAEFSFGIPWFK